MRGQYQAFIDDLARLRPSTAEACFGQQTLLVHAWRRFPLLDPDLPAALLSTGWPRDRAHALFVERHERWATLALTYFEQPEANYGLESRAA